MFRRLHTVLSKQQLSEIPDHWATFVQTASMYKAALQLSVNNKSYNAKSILAVLSAGVTCGSSIKLTADGADEQDAIAELEKLILENCGEINI